MIGKTWKHLTKEERKELLGGADLLVLEGKDRLFFCNHEKKLAIRGSICRNQDHRYGDYVVPGDAVVFAI
ncbi:hypothetical protein [Megasphaera sp. DJF_B143]|uniref:hypothetical protein n=1 Tax=Megasphaera sp. DJF_B143 TaxID=537288 RepID=UPI00073F7911|nr:hypothetical protein [Megasphaera sp. DJF_B143]KUH56044.1 hypothetical protein AT798_03640 [Megasphaera sp. DJF_B143]